jgi:hypothetical protein
MAFRRTENPLQEKLQSKGGKEKEGEREIYVLVGSNFFWKQENSRRKEAFEKKEENSCRSTFWGWKKSKRIFEREWETKENFLILFYSLTFSLSLSLAFLLETKHFPAVV